MTSELRPEPAPKARHLPPPPWDAILGLGSNMGDKRANIAAAIALLTAEHDIRRVVRSRDYRSAPWGVTNQDWFVNACVAVATRLDPQALLARCQRVEQDMGRVRRRHWGERIIDVDILLYRGQVIAEPNLVVPHPRIAERGFVLVPLAEIAPEARVAGHTVAELLARIDTSDVVPIDAAASP